MEPHHTELPVATITMRIWSLFSWFVWGLLVLVFIGELFFLIWGANKLLISAKTEQSIQLTENKRLQTEKDVFLKTRAIATVSVAPRIAARSVEEILNSDEGEAEMETKLIEAELKARKSAGGAAVALPSLVGVMDDSNGENIVNISLGNSELDKLIRQARAAQIAGDMRLTILKLEEAQTLHQNHPAILYYFGLTYEMLKNVTKAREYYLQVFKQREAAGPFYKEAAKKLEEGFNLAEDKRGQMSFGNIQVFREDKPEVGERVIVTIPIRLSQDTQIRAEDLFIPVQFFDIINGREIAFTRSEQPQIRWKQEPVDWAGGEETIEVTYFMPKLSSEELMILGDVKYYGFTAKLYYKGEPMDCFSSPNSLILIEQKKKTQNTDEYSGDGSLLPPIEATPASDADFSVYDASDEGLLP